MRGFLHDQEGVAFERAADGALRQGLRQVEDALNAIRFEEIADVFLQAKEQFRQFTRARVVHPHHITQVVHKVLGNGGHLAHLFGAHVAPGGSLLGRTRERRDACEPTAHIIVQVQCEARTYPQFFHLLFGISEPLLHTAIVQHKADARHDGYQQRTRQEEGPRRCPERQRYMDGEQRAWRGDQPMTVHASDFHRVVASGHVG